MTRPLISVERVKKRFCRNLKRSLWYGVSDVCSDLLVRKQDTLQLRKDEFFALNDVSFDIHRGESVALMGRNGAGKSTILKMINGLFYPDQGQITVRGRIAALIELGAGFNPVLSGRENIYVNAAILGMDRREVEKRLDEIIDFAELEQFIDMPLKGYSSGMKVRLGFSVACQLEPEVMLIDEVLAVGDAAFRAKCHRRLSKLMSDGTAFVLVSHNHHTLLSTCSRGVVLNRGTLIADGPIASALHAYEKTIVESAPEVAVQEQLAQARSYDSDVKILEVFFRDLEGNRIQESRTGQGCDLCIRVSSERSYSEVSMAIIVRESMNDPKPLLAISAAQDSMWHELDAGVSELRLRFVSMPFKPGRYVAKLSVSQRPMSTLASVEAFPFEVDVGAPLGDSSFYCEREWGVVSEVTSSQV